MTNLFPPNFLAFHHCLSFAPSVFILTTFSFSLGRAESKAPWVLVFLIQTDSLAQSLNFRPSHLWGILLHKENYMDVSNMLSDRACKHIWSLCSLLRGRKRRETRLWANGKRSMRRGIHFWKTEWQKKWGHPQQKDRRYFKSFSEILCVLGGSNQALLVAIVTMPLGAAVSLYKEGTCPGSSLSSTEKFSNGVLSAAGCCYSRGWRKARFLPEPTLSEKNSYLWSLETDLHWQQCINNKLFFMLMLLSIIKKHKVVKSTDSGARYFLAVWSWENFFLSLRFWINYNMPDCAVVTKMKISVA